MNTPLRDLEQQALAKVNQEKGWLKTNRAWLIAIATAFAIGFILAKLV